MQTLPADLRSLVIGVIAGIVTIFAGRAVDRYWTHRTIKSMRRRLEYAEAQKARLDELAKFDRSILLLGFGALFGLIGLASLFVFVSTTLSLIEVPLVARFHSILLWAVVAVVSFYFAGLFKQIFTYPESAQKLEKRIAELKHSLAGTDRPGGEA